MSISEWEKLAEECANIFYRKDPWVADVYAEGYLAGARAMNDAAAKIAKGYDDTVNCDDDCMVATVLSDIKIDLYQLMDPEPQEAEK